jgi:hypothetical protein
MTSPVTVAAPMSALAISDWAMRLKSKRRSSTVAEAPCSADIKKIGDTARSGSSRASTPNPDEMGPAKIQISPVTAVPAATLDQNTVSWSIAVISLRWIRATRRPKSAKICASMVLNMISAITPNSSAVRKRDSAASTQMPSIARTVRAVTAHFAPLMVWALSSVIFRAPSRHGCEGESACRGLRLLARR